MPWEAFLNARPFTISFATVLAMVALRVVVGWHFFQEGLAHKNNPKWAGEVEGFLQQAKGPLADLYRRQLPMFHGFNRLLIVPLGGSRGGSDEPAASAPSPVAEGAEAGGEPGTPKEQPKPESSPVYGAWYSQIVKDWNDRSVAIANFYHFSDEQKKAGQDLLDDYAARLAHALAGYESDIKAYRHALDRNQELAAEAGAGEIPNRTARLIKRDAAATSEPGAAAAVASGPTQWRSDVESLEGAFQRALSDLATDDQRKSGAPPEEFTELKKVATGLMWFLLVGGACLVAGLFTRLAALALALFLVTVIVSQPPWIPGTIETFGQGIELVALLVIATSHVGRWGGLDFFIHHVLLRPFRSR